MHILPCFQGLLPNRIKPKTLFKRKSQPLLEDRSGKSHIVYSKLLVSGIIHK